MAETKIKYNNIATDIAFVSLDGLGSGAWASSALVDNQSNLYVDAIVGGSIQIGAPTAAGAIDVYVAGSWDGVDFTAGVDAGDGAITWGTTGNTHLDGEFDVIPLGSIAIDAADDGDDVRFGPFSIAAAFGGVMPLEWCIVLENNTGAALDGTGTNNHLEYTGITLTSE